MALSQFSFTKQDDPGRAKFARDRRLAEVLAQQALTADPTQMAGGYAIRHTALNPLAKIAQALASRKIDERADTGERDYVRQQGEDRARMIAEAIRAGQAKEARPAIEAPPDELGGGPGRPDMPAQGPDPMRTYEVLAGSSDPMAQQFGLQSMLSQIGPKAPIKLGKDDRLVDATNYGTIVGPQQQPKITRVEIPDGKGGVRVGFVDMNNPNPMQTFQEAGTQGPKAEILPSGQAINPYAVAPGAVFNDPNKIMQVGPDGRPVVNQPLVNARKDISRAGATTVSVDARERQRTFENENKIRDDFKADPRVKAADEMNAAFRLIETANTRPSPANDLAMATKYMKILDPTSVVRESELGMALAATGLMDKVSSYAENIITGKKLNPAQRADFYESAKKINEAFQGEVNKVADEYRGIATQYGLKPENVTPGRNNKKDTPAPAAEQTQFDAMPSPVQYKGRRIKSDDGSIYMSDGVRWKKQ